MLLIPKIPPGTVLEVHQSYVWGTLTAIGEPRRRTWKASVHWTIRRGNNRGHLDIEVRWLTNLLKQVVTLERELILPFNDKPFQERGDSFNNPFCLRLYYGTELRQSVNNTAKRWCKAELTAMTWQIT